MNTMPCAQGEQMNHTTAMIDHGKSYECVSRSVINKPLNKNLVSYAGLELYFLLYFIMQMQSVRCIIYI